MSYCEQNYEPCSNRNKCTVRTCKYNMESTPVRDVGRNDMPSEEPPPPPPGVDGDWQLQYCKWWGWSWVKKPEKDETRVGDAGNSGTPKESPAGGPPQQEEPPCCPNNEKGKNGGIFRCFKKKKCCDRVGPLPAVGGPSRPPPPEPEEVKSPSQESKGSKPEDEEPQRGECCCCNYMNYDPCCCSCNQVCCPCMLQNQGCCCCMQPSPPQPPKPPPCVQESKCVQTCCADVREQSTKMSEVQLKKEPKRKVCNCGKRKTCMCRRQMCCRCVRPPCCPCVQNVCCPCGDSPQQESNPSGRSDNNRKNVTTSNNNNTRDNSLKIDEQIINYCLNRNLRKPNNDFMEFKSTNFSTLQKSLDILLKNNINIMNLFDDKKDLRSRYCPDSRLNSHHTITCLSSANVGKSSEAEHCKLLTAVCEAILSSHKFEDDKVDVKDSQNSFNTVPNRSFLQKILSDAHLPMLTKSSDVQVYRNHPSTAETYIQPKRSLTRLLRNKSKVLLAPRFTNKVDLLRKNNDLLKVGRHESKSLKRIFLDSKLKERRKPEARKINYFRSSDDDLNLSLDRLKLSSECTSTKPCISTKLQSSLKLDNVEHLLNSIDYLKTSTSGIGKQQKSDKRHSYDSLLRNGRNAHLLESTSPPFTDSDLLLSVDDAKSGSGKKDAK